MAQGPIDSAGNHRVTSVHAVSSKEKTMARFPWTTLFIMIAATSGASAQTMSFEQAGVVLLNSCGKDIGKYCPTVNLDSGRMRNCLLQNPGVSAACKADWSRVAVAVQRRAEARVTVLKVCEADAMRLCGLVQKGDGQILDCMLTAQRGVSAKCNQAITDAGYR